MEPEQLIAQLTDLNNQHQQLHQALQQVQQQQAQGLAQALAELPQTLAQTVGAAVIAATQPGVGGSEAGRSRAGGVHRRRVWASGCTACSPEQGVAKINEDLEHTTKIWSDPEFVLSGHPNTVEAN